MGIRDLIPEPRERGEITETGAFAGRILDTADGPDDLVRVRIPAFDDRQWFGPMSFMPRGAVLPAAGDPCLVIRDDDGLEWLVAWRPA